MIKDILWGASSSSFQAEGMWNKAGQGKSVIELDQPNNLEAFQQGVDFYHHYLDDIKLMQEAGITAFRFSISWTRIFPEGIGRINKKGVEFYHQLITALKQAHIEPIVTIYHFDYPLALVKKYGGWTSRQSINDYVSYCEFLFKEFGDDVKYWITINEQDHVVKIPTRLGFKDHDFSKHINSCYQANHYMSVASATAIKLCHKLLPNAKIGPALSYQPYYPATSRHKDVEAAKMVNLLTQKYILDLQCRGIYSKEFTTYLNDKGVNLDIQKRDLRILRDNPPDYLGVNYYSSNIVSYLPAGNKKGKIVGSPIPKKEYGLYEIKSDPKLPTTKWGWTVDPEGLRVALTTLFQQYHLPIMITENGYGDKDIVDNGEIDDQERIAYLQQHLNEIIKIVRDHIPVIGYCVWSFTDVISGHNGSNKRYGLVYVDQDMKRIPKRSFTFYQNFISKIKSEV